MKALCEAKVCKIHSLITFRVETTEKIKLNYLNIKTVFIAIILELLISKCFPLIFKYSTCIIFLTTSHASDSHLVVFFLLKINMPYVMLLTKDKFIL